MDSLRARTADYEALAGVETDRDLPRVARECRAVLALDADCPCYLAPGDAGRAQLRNSGNIDVRIGPSDALATCAREARNKGFSKAIGIGWPHPSLTANKKMAPKTGAIRRKYGFRQSD